MARPRKIDLDLVAQAQRVAARAGDVHELRMAQAVLLPALAQMSLKATAQVLGVGRATVARLQARFRRRKAEAQPTHRLWGGRRRALMKLEDEQAFLAAWKSKAEQGELVVRTPLRGALQEKLGRRVKPSVVSRLLERHHWRKVAPDTRHPKAEPSVQEEWKKTRPEKLAAVWIPNLVRERPIRLMFQDEARFGRMARIGRCWAPAPLRPIVRNGYEREFTCVSGALSPLPGELDWSLTAPRNTSQMSAFLSQVSQAHPQEWIVMGVDGASSHRAKDLVVPSNIRLIGLPGYSP